MTIFNCEKLSEKMNLIYYMCIRGRIYEYKKIVFDKNFWCYYECVKKKTNTSFSFVFK